MISVNSYQTWQVLVFLWQLDHLHVVEGLEDVQEV
jgi:hypothetical protein